MFEDNADDELHQAWAFDCELMTGDQHQSHICKQGFEQKLRRRFGIKKITSELRAVWHNKACEFRGEITDEFYKATKSMKFEFERTN